MFSPCLKITLPALRRLALASPPALRSAHQLLPITTPRGSGMALGYAHQPKRRAWTARSLAGKLPRRQAVPGERLAGMAESNPSAPLERSSHEFMVALVFASLTQLIPGWIAYMCCWVALAGVAVYFCWSSRATVDYGPGRKLFLCLCCVGFLFSFSYSEIMNRYREENLIPPTVMYMTGWGAPQDLTVTGNPPRLVKGIPETAVMVDGRLLDKYKKKFELMVVVFHVINNESYMDKTGISKSRLVKIRPEDLSIPIPYNQQFLNELALGANSDTYVLIAMPMKLKPEDFSTLNEAEDKGAQLIGRGTRVETASGSAPTIMHQ